jgi:hypothetical protein
MRSGLALCFSLALTGCGGSVENSVEAAVGGASARAGSPASVAGDHGFAGASNNPVEGEGGHSPVPVEPAGDAGSEPDVASGAGGRLSPSFAASGGSAGASGASSEVTRSVVDAPLAPRGFLSGMQYRVDADSASVFTIDAIFETTRGQWDGCTKVQLGECWYFDCPPGSAPYLPSVPLQNAGFVSLTTASVPSTTVDVGLLYDYWYEANATGELWPTSGKKLSFAATGSTVPAFALDIQSPPTVVLTSLNGEALPRAINRSDGAALRWTSSGSGIAYFSLYGFYDSKFAAVCEFDAAAHAGKLPAALLRELEPGPDYHLIFRGTSRAHATVEGWELDASLAGYGGSTPPYDPPLVALR